MLTRRVLSRLTGRWLHRRPVAAALVVCGLLALAVSGFVLARPSGHAGDTSRLRPGDALSGIVAARQRAANPAGPALGSHVLGAARAGRGTRRARRPVRLAIPAIGVHTHLIPLGLTPRGTLQVPGSTAEAGWYTGGPRPGQLGPAVIAGHIDSYTGPAVFYRLRLLRPGDLVYVRRAGGSRVVFRVYAKREFAKDRFPTTLVYGATPDAELRLITCGGTFDYATGSYLSNVVVFGAEVRVTHPRHRRRERRVHRAGR
jgi:sortase (surface protein transpeptidase)